MKQFHTCVELIRYIEGTYSNPTAFNSREKDGWHAISTEEFVQTVQILTLGLIQLGLKRGDKVGILAQPSPRWTFISLAIMMAGGISVPLFANISDENFVFEVKQTELRILFIEGDEQWDVFHRHEDFFDVAISMDDLAMHSKHSKILNYRDLIDRGNVLDETQPILYRQLQETITPDDTATIIYTSGSTGVPKGVELSQENIMVLLHTPDFYWDSYKDRYLSILPLAHVFGHSINLWMMAWGVSIYYSSDYKNLSIICKEVKPTVLVVVPRLLEKIYLKMVEQLHFVSGIKRFIGKWAFGLAKTEKRSLYRTLMLPIADKLVYSKLRDVFGGHLRAVLSGGAPLNPHLHYFFDEIGIPIYEGWGLTEACPICVNVPKRNKMGTVGPVLYGQQLKINDDGEICVKGSLVMKGYYKSPELTENVIDKDRWLHTGDRAKFDEEKYVIILGRMKELYKTSTGEYVAPVPIEQSLDRYPLIEMSMVIAESRKFTSALLFPNKDVLRRMKTKQNAENMSDEEFLNNPYVRDEIQKHLEEMNKHLNHWEQVHDYRFILEPLTIQTGELTPSLKIRRDVVAKKYSTVIESMYDQDEEVE